MIKRTVFTAILLCFSSICVHADLQWGVTGLPLTPESLSSEELQLDYVRGLGLRGFRVPMEDSVNPDEVAALIRLAQRRGIYLVPVIQIPRDKLEQDADALFARTYLIMHGLVSRFAADIPVWELSSGSLMELGDRQKTLAVAKAFVNGVRAAEPNVRVAVGGANAPELLERLKQEGVEWDISTLSWYGDVPKLQEDLGRLRAFEQPIWITEFSSRFGSQLGEDVQASALREMIRSLRELSPLSRVEAAFIYELMDEVNGQASDQGNYGLLQAVIGGPNGWVSVRPKPAYESVRDALSLVKPVTPPAPPPPSPTEASPPKPSVEAPAPKQATAEKRSEEKPEPPKPSGPLKPGPKIYVKKPKNGAVFKAGAQFDFAASIPKSAGYDKVEFSLEGKVICTVEKTPYECRVTLPSGTGYRSLTVVASGGGKSSTASIRVRAR